MDKRFSTKRDIQKGLLSYMEMKRGRREIKVTRRRRGKSKLTSNQFPVINSERFTEFHREEKREEGERGDKEEKRGVKRREIDLASNQFPRSSPQPRIPKEIHRVK